ncbi:MAG TPA: radical SAM protein [Vicinamibacterales bacterium]|jgi:MoaA/NifB/PqqE/SkfB family radical SAM enzyme|nr:radical SAM protein [Vicinamibacterales bacterium]
MKLIQLTRRVRKAGKRVREARMLVRSLKYPYRPVAAHLIPIRRCNLSCTYCNEYDDHSPPVPTRDVFRRIDRLADLGTGIITLSGGEPLLHPDLDDIVRRIRSHGVIATLITNGYLLSRDRIGRLNRAGLDHLQISIDNVLPDDVSKKSLKLLDQKLQWLAEYGVFDVTVNSVVGGGIRNPDDALTIARRARELGFSTTVGIIHDHSGQLKALDDHQRAILEQVVAVGKSTFDFANYNRFQKNLANAQPNDWHCGAGSRYLYVCEDGLVHWCSQQRGHPGIPLEHYGPDDLWRQYHEVKSCAPMCTVGCVHRVAQVDELRRDPERTLAQWFSAPRDERRPALPASVKVLQWAFVTGPRRNLFRGLAARVLGSDRSSSF